MDSDWISYFGYGSLVNRDTRPTEEVAHIARLNGWQRVWEHRVAGSSSRMGCTSLSVDPTAERGRGSVGGIDGVIVSMPRSLLAQLDEREAGYDRLELSAGDFQLPAHLDVESVMIYRSQAQNRYPADIDHPVLQSYIDCVLAGYLHNFHESGMRAFVESTRGWHGAIFNDRAVPRYPRSVQVPEPQQAQFDTMVRSHIASGS